MENLPAVITKDASLDLLKETRQIFETTETALDVCNNFAVVDHQSFEAAAENRNILNGLTKELDRVRKEFTAPLDDKKSQIMAYFKPYSNRLDDLKTKLEGRMMHYKKLLDNERKAEQERIDREAMARESAERDRLATLATDALNNGKESLAVQLLCKADQYHEPAAVLAPVHIPSVEVSTKTYWHAEVTDFSALEDIYKIANQKLLDSVATTLRDKAKVEGVRFYSIEGFAGKKQR